MIDSGDGDGKDHGKRMSKPPTDEAGLSARLKNLDSRLSDVKKGEPDEVQRDRENDQRAAQAQGMARGFRLSSELVAGVLVGAGIGWLLDRWFSTSPWGFIVFLLLGFVAGIINVMRAAGVMQGGMPDSTRRD
jgi:ATP synthase protein I